MAWLSVGTSNNDLCEKMVHHGLLKEGPILEAFRATDRGDFVIPEEKTLAYLDRPYRRGAIHISAPHMYASVLQSLEMTDGKAGSFLNIGSGSGYLTCLAAHLLGPGAVNHGVEISAEAVAHSQQCVARWLQNQHPAYAKTHAIQIVQGNCFDLDNTHSVRYDRIYVGAGVPASRQEFFFHLLAEGGVLVMPIQDSSTMVKVRKVYGRIYTHVPVTSVHFAPLQQTGLPQGLGEEMTEEDEEDDGLGVLDRLPDLDANELVVLRSSAHNSNAVLRRRLSSGASQPAKLLRLPQVVWEPLRHKHQQFPAQFRAIVKMLLLAANRVARRGDSRRSAPLCSKLPMPLWYHILSYTSRDWFVLEDRVLLLESELYAERQLRRSLERRVRQLEQEQRDWARQRDMYRTLLSQRQAAGTGAIAAAAGAGYLFGALHDLYDSSEDEDYGGEAEDGDDWAGAADEHEEDDEDEGDNEETDEGWDEGTANNGDGAQVWGMYAAGEGHGEEEHAMVLQEDSAHGQDLHGSEMGEEHGSPFDGATAAVPAEEPSSSLGSGSSLIASLFSQVLAQAAAPSREDGHANANGHTNRPAEHQQDGLAYMSASSAHAADSNPSPCSTCTTRPSSLSTSYTASPQLAAAQGETTAGIAKSRGRGRGRQGVETAAEDTQGDDTSSDGDGEVETLDEDDTQFRISQDEGLADVPMAQEIEGWDGSLWKRVKRTHCHQQEGAGNAISKEGAGNAERHPREW
eukprot:gene34034-41194_t